jgi:hypothetical protein
MKKLAAVLALSLALTAALPRPARAACFQFSLTLCFSGCESRYGNCHTSACADDRNDCSDTCIDENCPDGMYTY